MKIIRLSILLLFILSIGCVGFLEEKEFYGVYVPLNYKNTYDTVILKSKNVYERKLYDSKNILKLNMVGRWAFSRSHRIVLDGFYQNLDRDISKEKHVDTTFSISTYFQNNWGRKIRFCTGQEVGDGCYQKIE